MRMIGNVFFERFREWLWTIIVFYAIILLGAVFPFALLINFVIYGTNGLWKNGLANNLFWYHFFESEIIGTIVYFVIVCAVIEISMARKRSAF